MRRCVKRLISSFSIIAAKISSPCNRAVKSCFRRHASFEVSGLSSEQGKGSNCPSIYNTPGHTPGDQNISETSPCTNINAVNTKKFSKVPHIKSRSDDESSTAIGTEDNAIARGCNGEDHWKTSLDSDKKLIENTGRALFSFLDMESYVVDFAVEVSSEYSSQVSENGKTHFLRSDHSSDAFECGLCQTVLTLELESSKQSTISFDNPESTEGALFNTVLKAMDADSEELDRLINHPESNMPIHYYYPRSETAYSGETKRWKN